jgi:NADH-quinone oxidoreductase subunit J
METVFFWILAVLTVVGALGVILAPNPIKSAVALIGTFVFLAGIYVLLLAHLIAVLQILVYAGAIMVLFVFVIMLLNLQQKDLGEKTNWATKIVGVVLIVLLGWAVVLPIIGVAVPGPIAPAAEFGTIEAVGRLLFTRWLLPFEVTSLLLFAAIVGAVVVAKRKL